jgi:hypothetical protein
MVGENSLSVGMAPYPTTICAGGELAGIWDSVVKMSADVRRAVDRHHEDRFRASPLMSSLGESQRDAIVTL